MIDRGHWCIRSKRERWLVCLMLLFAVFFVHLLLQPSAKKIKRIHRVSCARQLAIINEAKDMYFDEMGHEQLSVAQNFSVSNLVAAGFVRIMLCPSVKYEPTLSRIQAMEETYVFDPELMLFVCKDRPEHTKEFLRRISDLRNMARSRVEDVRAHPKEEKGGEKIGRLAGHQRFDDMLYARKLIIFLFLILVILVVLYFLVQFLPLKKEE